MKKIFPVIAALAVLFSCSSKPGKKEVAAKKMIDKNWLDSVTRRADSTYARSYKRADFDTAWFYVSHHDSSVCQVMKDKTGEIRQVIIAKNDRRVFFAQYYSNGQVQADLPLDEFGQYHGNAVYYYENGITESNGVYRHGLKEGEWKNYDNNGDLVSTEEYDKNGQLLKKEEKTKS